MVVVVIMDEILITMLIIKFTMGIVAIVVIVVNVIWFINFKVQITTKHSSFIILTIIIYIVRNISLVVEIFAKYILFIVLMGFNFNFVFPIVIIKVVLMFLHVRFIIILQLLVVSSLEIEIINSLLMILNWKNSVMEESILIVANLNKVVAIFNFNRYWCHWQWEVINYLIDCLYCYFIKQISCSCFMITFL